MILGANPYYNRTSIKEECDFFGRRHELKKIENLIQEVPQSVSIVGDRRIGKSSLLRAVLHRRNMLRRPDEFVFIALDLQENMHANVPQFFHALIEGIAGACCDSSMAQREPSYENVRKIVAGLNSSRLKLVILLDEFDAVTRNRNFTLEFFSFLRSLPNNYSVSFIVTSARQLPEICHSQEIAGSPFFNIFHKLNLGPFPPAEALELITAPSQAVGYPLETYSDFILSLSGRFPFFLQMACSACFEYHQEHSEQDALDETVIRQSFYEEARDHFEYLWEHFSERDRGVCRRISGKQRLAESDHGFLQSLSRRGYVNLEPEVRLFSCVFDDFVQTQIGIEGIPVNSSRGNAAPLRDEIDEQVEVALSGTGPEPKEVGLKERSVPGDLTGELVGRFWVRARLGEGGMGEVYLATDQKLNRAVALKRMAAPLRENPEYHRRFLGEAQRVSQLSNPHIAGIYDVPEERGELFLVMEYIEGQTLRTLMVQRIAMKECVEIGRQCAEALAAAHQKGIVHRDIKPENIMVTPHGQVKVMDFGLAKGLPHGGDREFNQTVTLTRPGTFLGTPGYAAPELITGGELDGRSDIFSLGVVLYESLIGRHPFRAPTLLATVHSILHDYPPSLARLDPDVPTQLDSIVFRCLEKDPDRRYQRSKDLAADLARVSDDEVTPEAAELRVEGLLKRIVAWLIK